MCSLIAFTPCLSSFRPILQQTPLTGWPDSKRSFPAALETGLPQSRQTQRLLRPTSWFRVAAVSVFSPGRRGDALGSVLRGHDSSSS